MLLMMGFKNAEQDTLGRSSGCPAFATPHLSGDHQETNRLPGAPTGVLQSCALKEREERFVLVPSARTAPCLPLGGVQGRFPGASQTFVSCPDWVLLSFQAGDLLGIGFRCHTFIFPLRGANTCDCADTGTFTPNKNFHSLPGELN